MPTYLYRCPAHGEFEAQAGRDDRAVVHVCGRDAERLPFSGRVSVLQPGAIPDPVYAQEKVLRENRAKGWDYDRAVRHVRKHIREDREGNKVVDMTGATNADTP